jgi:hypothetical protein
MFLKMDMEKAFDRMEWPFILAILNQLRFSSIWISWVRTCITSTSFSILLNGSPFGQCTPERGLRQGDPLSPFLFILGTEVLSRLLLREEIKGSLKGLRIARNCAPINHLLFADDLLLFGKASLSEAACLRSCLEKYCSWSGQSINASKSSIRFSRNTNPATSAVIRNWFPYDDNPPKSLYLGLPIFLENSKRRGFQGIIDKVNKSIEGWRAKTLSQAGRLVLIKSVAATFPSYAMGSFLIPNSCCKVLDRSFKNFLWGFPPKKTRNLSLKAWDSICTPKAMCGLGIRKMREVNLALISKLGWQLLNNSDSLWVSQLQGKYLNSTSFLSPSPLSSSSWLWKGILKSKSFISKGACFRIHSQSSLPIWSSPWIPTIASFSPTPSPLLSHPPPQLLVSDLFTTGTTQSNPHWNIPMLLSLFDSTSISEILKINATAQTQTKLIWTYSPQGDFTTKSAHHLISSQRYAPTEFPLTSSQWKFFWKINLNDRLKLFLWKIAWDIVPSKIRLNAVFPIPPSQLVCPLCKVEEDSLPHLFFSCFFARVSWRLSPWPLDSLKWSSLTLPDWIKGIITPHNSFSIPAADSHKFQIFAAVFCDMIWFSRNQAIHKGILPDALKLAANIKRVTMEHFAVWSSKQKPDKKTCSKPPSDCYKINYDAVSSEVFSTQVAVCRNSKGKIIRILTQFRPPCSSTYDAALAAHLAALLAHSLKLSNFILEGVSHEVTDALMSPALNSNAPFYHVIQETITSFPPFSLWEAKYISRSQNFCALYVAYRAAARVLPGCIPSLNCPSSSIPICSGKDPPYYSPP